MMASVMNKLNRRLLDLSYLPILGLHAANTDDRAFRVQWIPALLMEIVCCSMASWIATTS